MQSFLCLLLVNFVKKLIRKPVQYHFGTYVGFITKKIGWQVVCLKTNFVKSVPFFSYVWVSMIIQW